jgi:radical SAM superfamily enzyme YgiQ (UPF0313 family)
MANRRFSKIMFVVPAYAGSHYEYVGLPAGLGYLSETLLDNGFTDQCVVDMRLGYNYAYLRRKIDEFSPDLIGVSMMSFRYKDHYELMARIKADNPGVTVVGGGPHISTFREKAMEECPAMDYGMTLEGEETFVEFASGEKEIKDIKGLLHRDGARVAYTGDRGFILELDKVKFPRYEYFELGKYPKFIPLVTSRGCPHSCIFCPVQLTIGRRLRVRAPEHILEEIGYWYSKGYRVFNVVDDNFTFHKRRILDICRGIVERGYKGVFSCRNGVRADTIDKEMLTAMKEAGFNYLAFGVESGSDRMLNVIKKGEKLEAIENAVRESTSMGFMVTLFFIMGLPTETEEDVLKSLGLAMKYPVFDVRFYNPIPFPGTELYDWVEKNRLFEVPAGEYLNSFSHWENKPLFRTEELPAAKRKELYEMINKKIKEHTLKTKLLFADDMRLMFESMGIPGFLSAPLARMYYTPFFQKYVIESGLASRLKGFIRAGKGRREK